MLKHVFLTFNRRYKYNAEILDFLYSIMVSLGAPRGHHILYYMYFKEIYARVVKQHISLAGILGMNRGVYRNVINGSLSKKKITHTHTLIPKQILVLLLIVKNLALILSNYLRLIIN